MEVGQQEINLMHGKIDSIRNKINHFFPLSREYLPLDQSIYEAKKQQLLDEFNKHLGEPFDFIPYSEILLGRLEGSSGQEDDKTVLKRHFPLFQTVDDALLSDYLKDKIKITSYGRVNNKKYLIREIKDNKVLESISTIYDIKEIKKHRKMCLLYKHFLKSLQKFLEIYDKMSGNQTETYAQYIKLCDDQIKFNEAKKNNAYTPLKIIDNEQQIKTELTKIDQEIPENIQAVVEKQLVVIPQFEVSQPIEAQQEQASQSNKIKPNKQLKKSKIKKQRKTSDSNNSDQSSPSEKSAKQAIKKPTETNLFDYIRRTTMNKPQIILELPEQEHSISFDKRDINTQTINEFVKTIQCGSIPLEQLREELYLSTVKVDTNIRKQIYSTVLNWQSRLQFQKHPITTEKLINFDRPYEQLQGLAYADDSSVQYLELCGEVCNQQEKQIVSDDQPDESDRDFIVPDRFLCEEEVSSDQQFKGEAEDIKVEISCGKEWAFIGCKQNNEDNFNKAQRYTMVCLEQNYPLPIQDRTQEEFLSLATRIDMYKQIHGFQGAKQALIKRLQGIHEKASRNYLDNMIKEITLKEKGNKQRLLKKEIIEELSEQVEGIEKILEDIKKDREKQVIVNQQVKKSEKDQQIEKAILEWDGSYYLPDIRKHLIEVGHRMTKKDLEAFIVDRVGNEWDTIRLHINKIEKKTKQSQQTLLQVVKKPDSLSEGPPTQQREMLNECYPCQHIQNISTIQAQ